jgi:perosamine synthetase
MISLFKVPMKDNIEDYVIPVLKSGFVSQGPKVEEFEKKLQEYFNHPYILTVNSGTSRLTLAVKLLNLNPDDEVITPSLTCTATNLNIKWADVDPNTCNINVLDVMNKIKPKL